LALCAPFKDFVCLTRILSEGLQVTPSSVSVEFAALDNYPSAHLLQPKLEAYLAEDLALGHLAKVHISQIVSPLYIHPIALVPKPGQPSKFHLITDISFLAGTSVKDLTLPLPPFQMVKVRNLFRRIQKFMWGGQDRCGPHLLQYSTCLAVCWPPCLLCWRLLLLRAAPPVWFYLVTVHLEFLFRFYPEILCPPKG
jgi:hypothetical protein